MPTYDYRCAACKHEFELFQRMTDRVKRKCPECGAFKLNRLMGTGAGVIFKGSGFYETDYKRKSSSSNGSSRSVSGGSSEKSSSENESSEKGSSEKGSSEKGSSEKGSSETKKEKSQTERKAGD